MNKCKSCGAPIVWAKSETGKAMPLDAKPEKRIVLDSLGVGRVLDAFTSHFVTCPNAAQHRKPRETKSDPAE